MRGRYTTDSGISSALDVLQQDHPSPISITGNELIKALYENVRDAQPVSEVLLFKFVIGNPNISETHIEDILGILRAALDRHLMTNHELFLNYSRAMACCAKALSGLLDHKISH